MSIFSFLMLIVVAITVENVVFERALGINRWVKLQDTPKNIIWYGGLFGTVLIISTVINHLISSRLSDFMLQNVKESFVSYTRAISFTIVVLVTYTITYVIMVKVFAKKAEMLRRLLPITTFNTALFGVFYISFNRGYDIWQSLAYAVGTTLGYSLAILLLYSAKKRLAFCPAPKSFKGTPILLIYIGIISLGLYALIGYGLTS